MKIKIILAVFGLLIVITGFIAWKVFGSSVNVPQEKYFYIHSGDNLETVQIQLSEQKIISSPGWFKRVSGWLKYRTPKPGRYAIEEGSSLYSLIRMLRSGKQAMEKIVIVKERTPELFAGKFNRKYDLEFDSLRLISFLKNNDSLKRFNVDTNTVMSLIMPFTYNVNWNSTASSLLSEFEAAHRNFWTSARKSQADSLGLSPLQVSVLASIVEEETTRKNDKYNIASTYLNRLKKGMKLQADPTVKFITRNFQLGRIQGSHLKLVSPYNTYLNTGLPPGPICTPSVESIEAVLNAPATNYLFFVASHKFDGSTVFTENYVDHLKYVKLFHDEQNRRADSVKKAKSK